MSSCTLTGPEPPSSQVYSSLCTLAPVGELYSSERFLKDHHLFCKDLMRQRNSPYTWSWIPPQDASTCTVESLELPLKVCQVAAPFFKSSFLSFSFTSTKTVSQNGPSDLPDSRLLLLIFHVFYCLKSDLILMMVTW